MVAVPQEEPNRIQYCCTVYRMDHKMTKLNCSVKRWTFLKKCRRFLEKRGSFLENSRRFFLERGRFFRTSGKAPKIDRKEMVLQSLSRA